MRLHRASNFPCRRAKREFQRDRARIYCFDARAREMMIHKAARRRSYRLNRQPNRPSGLLRRRASGIGTSQSRIPCHSCPESHLDHGARPALLSNDQYSENCNSSETRYSAWLTVIQGTRLLLLHFEGHRLLKHRRVCSDLDERAKSRVWHVSAGIRPPFSCLATEIG